MEIQITLPADKEKSQKWNKYNLAKTNEKRLFYELLDELCKLIPEPKKRMGRPPIPTRDMVFMTALKLYNNFSSRKIWSDLKFAERSGYIKGAPHFNRLSDFLNSEGTYDLLQKLLTITAMPLKNLEDHYSIDASGFGGYQNERWMNVKYHKRGTFSKYLKGHIAIGTRTNVICSCEVTSAAVGDARAAPLVLENLSKNFQPLSVSADRAYSAHRILTIIEKMDAEPFVPFKTNTNPNKKSPEIWIRLFKYFQENQEEFNAHYHKRSNVETTFYMVKSRLGEFLRSKLHTSQKNELMMKFICHNICCLIQEVYENEIHVSFKKQLQSFISIDKKDFTVKTKSEN